MIARALLHALAAAGHAVPGESGFVDHVPAGPDEIVVVTDLGGDPDLATAGEADTRLQIRVRGAANGSTFGPAARAAAIAQLLRHQTGATWAQGLPEQRRVIEAVAGLPAFLGTDTAGRPEYVIRAAVRHA